MGNIKLAEGPGVARETKQIWKIIFYGNKIFGEKIIFLPKAPHGHP